MRGISQKGSQPMLLASPWRHPRKAWVRSPPPDSTLLAELPRPRPISTPPHSGLTLVNPVLVFLPLILEQNHVEHGGTNPRRVTVATRWQINPPYPSSRENKILLNVFLCFCFYF